MIEGKMRKKVCGKNKNKWSKAGEDERIRIKKSIKEIATLIKVKKQEIQFE